MSDYDPNFIPQKSFAIVGQKIIVRNAENKILVLRRSAKSGSGGKWSLPGGALERGEDPKYGIQREVMEEAGITVHDVRPFHVKSYKDGEDFVVIIGYVSIADSEVITLNWEHDDYAWLTKEEAERLALTADGRTFIEQYPTV